jgi:hypothetical protein
MTPQIDDAHIDKNEIVSRAMEAIQDGFARHGYLTKSSFDERVWTAIYDQLQHAEITPLK